MRKEAAEPSSNALQNRPPRTRASAGLSDTEYAYLLDRMINSNGDGLTCEMFVQLDLFLIVSQCWF